MHWLSESAETLIEACDAASAAATVEVAVVGSGYGGAVAALRFAEHGQSVYLLERGNEYLAGEFPNDLSQSGKHVRAEISNTSGVTQQGYPGALFDVRIGLRAGALVGNGLGGGSLINAGVGLQPDERVFRQDEWPAAVREDQLDSWFQLARTMLELQTPGQPQPGCAQPADPTKTAKYHRMLDLHESTQQWHRSTADHKMEVAFEPAPIAVQLDSPAPQDLGPRQPCIGCGDCVTGCNHQAKLSLTATYLPRAVKAGARLFSGVTVLHVSHDPTGDSKHPWVLHFVRTGERQLRHDIARDGENTDRQSLEKDWVYTLRARRVVLGAGAFGSTEILLRSRDKGLSLTNTALGVGVSGNGDDVAFGHDLLATANAVGWGSRAEPPPVVGPTISALIRYTDPNDVKRSTLVQDGAVPGLMQRVFHELTTTLGALAQMGHWTFSARDGGDPLALKPGVLNRTLTLLGMGHDSARGVIVYHRDSDRVQWAWPEAADETTPALHKSRMQGCVEALGGLYIQNPAVSAVPDSMGDVLSGPQPGGAVFTVHPLGGCRMGDMPVSSVVNHWGAVWRGDGELHDGLYVMDGSTIPSALGANPMLTITALAERACALILRSIPKGHGTARDLPVPPVGPKPLRLAADKQATTQLAEVLRGALALNPKASHQAVPASLQALFAGQSHCNSALFLQFKVRDWQAWMDKPAHRLCVLPTPADGDAYGVSRLVWDTADAAGAVRSEEWRVTGGWVELFRQRHDGWPTRFGRWWRTLGTYFIGRWWPDYKKNGLAPNGSLLDSIKGAWKLIGHANEVREFRYEIWLVDLQNQRYILTGFKVIEAAAPGRAFVQWLCASGWPPLVRRSLWQQLTEIHVDLFQQTPDGRCATHRPLASGRLVMDLPDMMRRVAPQLGLQHDSLTALLGLAGYGLLLLRGLMKTRLLDFRLPDQAKDLPAAGPAKMERPAGYFELEHVRYPDLPGTNGVVKAMAAQLLQVPLTWPTRKGEEPEMVRLGLVRYPQPSLKVQAYEGQHRVRSIVLINGFLLSTQSFVAEELNARGGNLAAQLHRDGWDVWLFEYRASPLLDVSARNSTIDDIAAFDVPGAVDEIIKTVCAELNMTRAADVKLKHQDIQIFAFSRCVGSAALAMSLLGGHLRHPNHTNKLAGVLLSDFHPFLVGSVSGQLRLQLAGFLANVLKVETLHFTAGSAKLNLMLALMDRLFASAHYADGEALAGHYLHEVAGERCPQERDLRQLQVDSTTCKRISGLMSRSYSHDQLLEKTHAKLDHYFGRGNVGVFLQGVKCMAYERLVNADGQNVYVTDEAILRYMNMPLMLMHGQRNVLFDPESLSRSWTQLARVFGPNQAAAANSLLPVDDHAHVDLILGKNAPTAVFPHVLRHFDQAFTTPPAPLPPLTAHNRCRARLPRTGPIVGWVRPGSALSKTLVRIWIEVDDSHADLPVAALTVLSYGGQTQVQTWWVQVQGMASLATENQSTCTVAAVAPLLYYAVADVEVDTEHLQSLTLQMFSLHTYKGPDSRQDELVADMPADWGAAMSLVDVDADWTPAMVGAGAYTPLVPPMAVAANPPLVVPPLRAVPAAMAHTPMAFRVPGRAWAQGAALPAVNLQLPPGQVRPRADLPIGFNPDVFLLPLQREVERARALTRQADPGTLSRKRRTLRDWQQRTVTLARAQWHDADDGTLRFFAAACRHPGLTAAEFYRADASLAKACVALPHAQPRFMLMLGDQIYADARAGLFDTQSPIERLLPRYRSAFASSSGFRTLARRLPLYMVIDDHEINDNWSQEQARAGRVSRVLASNARDAFAVFQQAHGPDGPGPQVMGFNYSYSHSGYPFIVLDTRTQRTRVPRRILHDSQWYWLMHWLLAEQDKGAHPKFVVSGSVLAPGLRQYVGHPAPRDADTWQMSPDERQRLLSFIADHEIDNVVFVSSDYHCSAIGEIGFTHSPVKAWAVVAPPLHAPLRFASSDAQDVLTRETITLTTGSAHVKAKAWNGEGWLDCRVVHHRGGVGEPAMASSWTVELRFHLRQLEQAEWPKQPISHDWMLR